MLQQIQHKSYSARLPIEKKKLKLHPIYVSIDASHLIMHDKLK